MNNDMTTPDKKKKTRFSKLFSSRKFKYGSSAAIFTAIFIIFVILLNVVLSVVDNKTGGLYADMTSKKIYGITDATREALKDVTLPVEVIFCRPADIIASSQYMDPVKRLAESYTSEYSNVSVVYHDIKSDPTYFNQFKKASTDTISDSSVIINCPSTSISTVYTLNSFYKTSTSGALFAFDGENKLTTAILRTARPQSLKAAFTKGHGETNSETLRYLLNEQGYEVSQIDLKTVSKEDLSTYNLVIICNPTSDFTGLNDEKEGMVNEISLLNNYLTGSFGNLFVFLSPETTELPEFRQFLSDDWGVTYTPGVIMSEDGANTVSSDGYAVLGTYSTDANSAGYQVHSVISKTSTSARAIFDYATPLDITFTENGYKKVSPVALTSEGSKAVTGSQSEKSPSRNIMTLSEYTRTNDSGDKHAYVLTCGSSYFLNYIASNYVQAAQYANTDLVKGALRLTGNSNIAANIDFKVLDETTISVTKSVSDRLMRRLAIIVPVIICVIGTAVFIKRKYR